MLPMGVGELVNVPLYIAPMCVKKVCLCLLHSQWKENEDIL